jgi:purine-nucleoside phosphorylase
MNALVAKIRETADAIRSRHAETPVVGLILGSGLGSYADTMARKTVIPYEEIPHFPKSTVPGHSGNLVLGEAEGLPVVALQGRVHLYEGYSTGEVTYGARVLGTLGVRCLVVTNASGGVNVSFRPGDLMLISDHINLTGTNPLIGPNAEELGERFPDMSDAYSAKLRAMAKEIGAERGIPLREGVYAGLAGPSFETPAEIRMLRLLGADAVGMSTVPEVIVARHMKMEVLGISCITNMAAGILPQKLAHQEVIETTTRVKAQYLSLLQGVIPRIPTLL